MNTGTSDGSSAPFVCWRNHSAEMLLDQLDQPDDENNQNIQLILGHADIRQTQRYLNITDEELRRAMTGVWERRRLLHAVAP